MGSDPLSGNAEGYGALDAGLIPDDLDESWDPVLPSAAEPIADYIFERLIELVTSTALLPAVGKAVRRVIGICATATLNRGMERVGENVRPSLRFSVECSPGFVARGIDCAPGTASTALEFVLKELRAISKSPKTAEHAYGVALRERPILGRWGTVRIYDAASVVAARRAARWLFTNALEVVPAKKTFSILAPQALLERGFQQLPETKRRGRQEFCCCPWHEDRTPSMALRENRDPRSGWATCFACVDPKGQRLSAYWVVASDGTRWIRASERSKRGFGLSVRPELNGGRSGENLGGNRSLSRLGHSAGLLVSDEASDTSRGPYRSSILSTDGSVVSQRLSAKSKINYDAVQQAGSPAGCPRRVRLRPVEVYWREMFQARDFVPSEAFRPSYTYGKRAKGVRVSFATGSPLIALANSDRSGPVAETKAWGAAIAYEAGLNPREASPDRYLSASLMRATAFVVGSVPRQLSQDLLRATPKTLEAVAQEYVLVDIDDLDTIRSAPSPKVVERISNAIRRDPVLSGAMSAVWTSLNGLQFWLELARTRTNPRAFFADSEVRRWYQRLVAKILGILREEGFTGGHADDSAFASGRYGRRPGWRLIEGEPFRARVIGTILERGGPVLSSSEVRASERKRRRDATLSA